MASCNTSSLLLGLLVLVLIHFNGINALSSNYYDQTCPMAESTVTSVVKKAMLNDQTVPAALLRMHFHDCFIRVNQMLYYKVFYYYFYNIKFGFSKNIRKKNIFI